MSIKIKQLSSLVKVFFDEEPKEKEFTHFSMLKNEKASMQVALFSDKNVEIELKIDTNIKNIKAYCVEEIYSKAPVGKNQDDYTLRRVSGMFPDLLREVNGAIKLTACKWQSIWFEIVPDGAIPTGDNFITIIFSENGKEVEKTVFNVEIIDANLPEQTLIFTNWFHTDCIATRYKVEVFSEKYWELVEKYLKVACDYGMNMVMTPLVTPPLDTKIGGERPTVQLVDIALDNGEYSYKFDKLDKWIAMCERCGIKYFEMTPLFTQWGAKHAPKIMATVDGEYKQIFGWKTRSQGKKYKAFLTSFAQALNKYLADKGIKERCMFHISDEPNIATMRKYKQASALINQHFGDYKIIDALSDYKFYQKGLVKQPIPSNDHINPFIGNVPELWTYYCCCQCNKYVSNRFFSMPSQRNRVLGYQLYKHNVKGFLHWGFNFWYAQLSVREIDPFTETDAGGGFPSGDSYVVYPGEDGTPLQSLRLKVFYDAFQDMRALQLLESYIGREKTIELIDKNVENGGITFNNYPHSDDWQLDTREIINRAIKEAMAK